MGKDIRRFLWGLLGIVLLFFSIQNIDAVLSGVRALLDLIMPLLYGCIIAFVLNLIVRRLERYLRFGPFRHQTVRRVTSIFLSLLILVGALAGIVAGVVPEIRDSAALLMEKLPGILRELTDFCVGTLGLPEKWFTETLDLDVAGFFEKLIQNDTVLNVLKSGGSFVGGALSGLFDLLVGLCFSFYILMQKEKLSRDLKRLAKAYLKPRSCERLLHVVQSMNEIYGSFISGQCMDAIILGAMITVALAIFRINYSILIGIVVAVTALVPVVGAFIGGAIGVFLLLMVSPKDAILFLVLFLVLQQVDNRLIYPHVVGSAVGLPAIWIFAAIVVGGNFGGIFGMILAIPLFALFYTLLAQDLRKREAQTEKPPADADDHP